MEKNKSMMIEEIKNNKGITLLALAVTIVVLLILTSIGIKLALGNNGIIGEAKNAKEQAEIDEEKGIVKRATTVSLIKSKGSKVEQDTLEKALNDETGEGKTEVNDVGDVFEVVFVDSNRYYEVDEDGNISDVNKITKDNYAGDITKGGRCDGSEEKPYEISCIEDLVAFSNMSNGTGIILENGVAVSVKNTNTFEGKYVVLTRDLNFKSKYSYDDYTRTDFGDLNEDGEVEIIIEELQKARGYTPILSFYGNINGNYKEIRNIYIYNKKMRYAGLFSEINSETTVKNLAISGEISSEVNYVGGIAGVVQSGGEDGKIENCHNYANIYGNGYAGGLVGYIHHDSKISQIVNCSNTGNVKNITNNYFAGGIVGNSDSTVLKIEKCYNTGEVECGIAANNKSFINNCYNAGKTEYGLVRANQNEVRNCYNIGKCTGNCLIKYSDYTLSHIYNCFSEKDYADKITLKGTIDDVSEIFESGYMKTNEFLNCLNNDNVWVQDTENINNGYPIFEWQMNK